MPMVDLDCCRPLIQYCGIKKDKWLVVWCRESLKRTGGCRWIVILCRWSIKVNSWMSVGCLLASVEHKHRQQANLQQ
ncbi:hypothetical protein AMTR_s00180p00029320 [Amborella trichopoda]|uniref:Uncharacterized protein n=1 Tax=Amborella trichopoda TaxID=13333 RepID=W1PZ47_AMBTC|nr:hypothetical protein AMTR_s00180p00029320 [Amborella trichopoda]